MPALTVSALTRNLGGRRLTDGVSVSVAPGETLAVTGACGSGKSVLLRCIAGADTPDSGEIRFGDDARCVAPPHLRPVAYVAQGATLWPQMTVRANVAFGPESLGLPAAETRSRVDAALRLFGAESLAERRPATLSGGEQARVALARATARGAAVLLLDEPFAWLDEEARDAAFDALRRHAGESGAGVVVATRDPAVIHACDRALVLESGRAVQCDAPDALWRRPLTVGAALATGPANLIAATVVRCGAGEFLAESALGEWRGALADPEADPEAGARITVLVRPEHLRVSAMPPDENVFPGVRLAVRASQSLTRFRTAAGPALIVRECVSGPIPAAEDADPLYVWAMPEDVVGLLR